MTPPTPPYRVAVLVNRFPVLTQTPVVRLVTGLLDRGHAVDLYSRWRGPDPLPQWAAGYALVERARFGPPVSPPWLRRLLGVRAVQWGLPLAHRVLAGRRGEERVRAGPPGRRIATAPPLRSRRPWTANYDILHAQFGPSGLKALWARDAGFLTGALVVSFRGYDATWWPHGRREGIYARLFRRGQLFLPVCSYLARRLAELGCPEERIRVFPSGLDTAAIPFTPARAPVGTARLVLVGRLVEKKGVDIAVRAMERLVARHRDVTLDVVGEGDERPRLEAMAREARLGDRVRFHGALPPGDALEMVRSASLCLCPSRTAADGDTEGIPNTAKEAMAVGVPVIASRHAGLPELIDHERSGLLVPENDAAALAEAVERLLDHPELWPEMTAAARRTVEERFDTRRWLPVLEGFYREASGATTR